MCYEDGDEESDKVNLSTKSCIQETLNLLTNTDSSTDTKMDRFFFLLLDFF